LLILLADVVDCHATTLSECDTLADEVLRLTKIVVHRAIKVQKGIFSASEPCPCGSGR
jgi:hypothetical protein